MDSEDCRECGRPLKKDDAPEGLCLYCWANNQMGVED
jgi:hypothetical protein